MSSQRILHVLALHLYQPPGQLQQLMLESESELQRILACYERIPRLAQKYADVAQLHVVFSIPLLQQLTNPEFINQACHLADIPGILAGFRSASNIEFVSSGYQHAPLPLVPAQDWDAQLRSESRLIEETFGHQPKGYYPPGGLFAQAMIPHLVAAGYRYVLLPRTAMLGEDGNPVGPYQACQLDENLVGIPIDEGFSHAQEHFIEAPWFADEVANGIRVAPESASPYLVTTCSDGENGEWFRRSDEENGFFGHFFAPYMEFCETGEYPIRPVNVIAYLQQAQPLPAKPKELDLQALRHPALERLARVSGQYWEQVKAGKQLDPATRELILQAEGSGLVLDQDPEYKKLLGLLDRIEALLIAPKTPTSPAAGRPPAGKPPADKPLAHKTPADKPPADDQAKAATARPLENTHRRLQPGNPPGKDQAPAKPPSARPKAPPASKATHPRNQVQKTAPGTNKPGTRKKRPKPSR